MLVFDDNWPPSLTEKREILTRCVEAFDRALSVECVIVFGSHARGQAKADSDVDFCVVIEGSETQHQAAIVLRKAIGGLRGKPPLTIIPITKKRLAEKKRIHDPFYDVVLKEGVCVARREGA